MSYGNAWSEDIAKRLESGDFSAADEVATNDTGSSTTLEYSLAAAVQHLRAKNIRFQSALKQLAKHCNDVDYWQVASDALAEAVHP